MKRYRSVNRDVFCAGKDGKVSVFGGLLCLFLVFILLSCIFFFFTFLLSLLHHNKTFSTNIHREPIVRRRKKRKSPVGAMMKQSHSLVQHCVQWHWLLLGRQTWYCFLPPPPLPPPVNLLSFNCT